MNDLTSTQTNTELVFRRFTDPLSIFGWEPPYPEGLPGFWWGAILTVVLLLAFFYVGWMYLKDSRGVGPLWATFLGVLRITVYIALAFVFLLPASQVWDVSTDQSKVLVIFDPTTSMTDTRDDLPQEGKAFVDLPTRQDKVLAFLQDKDFGFINRLLDKNPVWAYRFGTHLDESFLYLTKDGDWTREEWETRAREQDPTKVLKGEKLPFDYWKGWLKPNRKIEVKDPGVGGDEQAQALKSRLLKLAAANGKLDDTGVFKGTNVTQAVLDTLNREMNKMVQGIIVVTDGRNTTPASTKALLTLEERARTAKIPIFVVGVGTNRPQIQIDVADLRAPKIIRPEDTFKPVAEVNGEGLADQPANVLLDVARVNTTKDGKEELLNIVLIEGETKGNKDAKKAEIDLGKKVLVLQPTEPVKFDRSSPPRASAEFQFDAASLARAAGIDLTTEMYRGKKWEIAESRRNGDKEGDEFILQARIAVDAREVFAGTAARDVVSALPVADKDRDKLLPLHVGEKTRVQVIRKPLQVLIFASGAMRDYQFAERLLFREMEKERVMLSIFIQSPPGVTERRTGIVQDVPANRLLDAFPDKFDQPADTEDEKLKDLSTYDVILAFDPDWTQLSDVQLENVRKWVDRGGGLIAVGGPINTLQLARPGANRDKLKPIIDLYPVVLKDIRIDEGDRKPDRPWPLNFEGATPEMEFLKLSDEVEQGTQPFLSDWHEFWGRGKDDADKTAAVRGIFNYYPLEQAKIGSLIVARFMDPQAKMTKDGTQMPYIVATDPASNRRVVWIGSGEMWRLRQYKEVYHERFWTKLVRYAGTANAGKSNKRITVYIGRRFPAAKFVEFEAKIDGKGGQPLSPRSRPPEVVIKVPAGVNPKEIPNDLTMKPKAGSEGIFSGRFMVRTPGQYELEIKVPETGDTSAAQKFMVTPSNPELDNTRPDFDLMYRMASEADLVLPRMDEPSRQELRRRLIRPVVADLKPLDKSDDKNGKESSSDEKMRLYFDLKNAELIPSCMRTDTKDLRARGPVSDWWDDGFIMWENSPNPPTKFSWILMIVVGLLSVEWLTRKLLRLA
jgi:hypothetical protein